MQKSRAIRIIKKLLLGLVTAVALYGALGFLVLPLAARYVVNEWLREQVSVPARLGKIECNPFSGELSLLDFQVGEKEHLLIAFSRLSVDVEIDSLWTRTLHLQAISLDNAEIAVRRAKDGTFDLASVLALPASADAPATEQKPLFPLRIDAVALNNANLTWRDEQGTKPVNVQVQPLTLSMKGLSTLPGESGSLTLHADAGKAGRLDIFADIAIADRRAAGTLRLEEGNLARFWPYVQSQVPLVLRSGQLGIAADFSVTAGDTLAAKVNNGKLALRSLALTDRHNDARLLNLAIVDASGISTDLQTQRVQIGALHVEGLHAPIVREPDGRLNWQRVLAAAKGEPNGGAKPVTTTGKANAWRIDIPAIVLQQVDLPLTDQSVTPATTLDFNVLQLKVHDFDSTNAKPLRFSVNSSMGTEGKLSGEGQIALSSLAGDVTLSTQDLDLRVAQAYLSPFVRMELRSGLLDSQLRVQLASVDPLAFSLAGDIRVHQLHTVDTLKNQDLLKWQQLQLTGMQYQHGEHLLIEKVNLQSPYGRFVINENRGTNFGELIIAEKPVEATNTEESLSTKPPTVPVSKPLAIRIGSIDIENGSANFADYSLTPNFSTAIAQLNGKIGTLDNRQVTPSLLDIKGKVDRYAPVSIAGRLTPFDPLQTLDINARFKRVELTTLTPYSGKFAGYRIRKGRLNLDLHYQINQGQLNARNKVVLEELQLGDKVESPDAVDLPVRLAVALLKDARGNIKVELPVEGDLNNPRFSVGPVLWKTFRNLIVRAVKSPFSFISGLIKGDESENLDSIAFAPGSSVLSEGAREKLKSVVAILQQRPELRLEIEGASAREPDADPMAQQLLEGELRSAYARQLQASGKRLPADIDTVQVPRDLKPVLLATMYVEWVKKPEPVEWKDLPERDHTMQLQTAILDYLGESERRLRQLARDRAAGIKGWLVEEGGLGDERIYLLNTQLHEKVPAESVVSMLFLDSE